MNLMTIGILAAVVSAALLAVVFIAKRKKSDCDGCDKDCLFRK